MNFLGNLFGRHPKPHCSVARKRASSRFEKKIVTVETTITYATETPRPSHLVIVRIDELNGEFIENKDEFAALKVKDSVKSFGQNRDAPRVNEIEVGRLTTVDAARRKSRDVQ